MIARRILALALILFTGTASVAAPAAAAEQAIFSGRVLKPDGVTPRDGVVIALVNVETSEMFRSPPTGDEGAFRIDAAPAGSYRIAAETDEGAFVAAQPLELQAGANEPLAFKLAPGASTASIAPAQGQGQSDRAVWHYVVGALTFLGALWAIDDSGKDVEEDASAF